MRYLLAFSLLLNLILVFVLCLPDKPTPAEDEARTEIARLRHRSDSLQHAFTLHSQRIDLLQRQKDLLAASVQARDQRIAALLRQGDTLASRVRQSEEAYQNPAPVTVSDDSAMRFIRERFRQLGIR